jgi:uncharacterized protein (DUF305 family)
MPFRTIPRMRRGHLGAAALVLAFLVLPVPGGRSVAGALQQGTPDTDQPDPCAEIVAAGTPAVAHGPAGPGALNPVPAEQTGELGNPADYPFDLAFVDATVAHDEAAVVLAEIALVRAEHEELREVATAIISAQETEIAQLRDWRAAWYGDADPVPRNVTIGLIDEGLMLLGGPADTGLGMGGPAVGAVQDAYALCTTTGSFDLAFLDLMISHHQGALGLAKLALERAEHEELRTLAQQIAAVREAEIARMTEWRGLWAARAPATPSAWHGGLAVRQNGSAGAAA